jgi:hypothetical protein
MSSFAWDVQLLYIRFKIATTTIMKFIIFRYVTLYTLTTSCQHFLKFENALGKLTDRTASARSGASVLYNSINTTERSP